MDDETVIEISDVWEDFRGPSRSGLAGNPRRGLTKADVLARHNAVVGVADVSLSVKRGEIFCIMACQEAANHARAPLQPAFGADRRQDRDRKAPT